MAKAKDRPTQTTDRRTGRAVAPMALATCLALTLVGCQSVSSGGGGGGLLSRISPRHDESMADGMVRPEGSSPGRFMSRYLNPMATPHASAAKEAKKSLLGPEGWSPVTVAPDPEAETELAEATRLYRQGKHSEAEPRLARLATAKKGTPWGESARFTLAESLYERKKFVAAYDAYELLIKEYPGTKHVDALVAREFAIAKAWLDDEDPNAKPEQKIGLAGRAEGRAPLIDASGFAIKALENVRLHDPAGPLSDDAVLLMADHYFAHKDFESAALYYDQLVTDHPKSEHLRRAQLSSIDAKMKGYGGPEFDGQGLDGARDMVKQTMATFPERQVNGDRDKLYETLDRIEDASAERAFATGQYYKRVGRITSAEYYYSLVNAKWPKSDWGKKAKVELAGLAKLPRKAAVPSKIMTQPGSSDSFGDGLGTAGNPIGGMGGQAGGLGGAGGPG